MTTTTATTATAPLDRPAIVDHALTIAKEYDGQGLTLTLRQMYYQFVARGLIANGQKSYKRIGAALTAARYAGTFPIEWLEDRGRTVNRGDATRDDTDVDDAMSTASRWLRSLPELTINRARWYGQPVHVSVWVEKEALAGIFEPTCNDLGVGWFACKGYPSVSSLRDWIRQVNAVCGPDPYFDEDDAFNDDGEPTGATATDGRAERAIVLYFGDHDPDGWEIPRSCERNIAKLRRLDGLAAPGEGFDIEFIRIGLNMDQILTHNPPPFPAKVSSSRCAGYIEEHGTDDAWELDALDPTTLRDLIREHVTAYFDDDIAADNRETVDEVRDEVRRRVQAPGWAAGVLAG